MTAGKPRVLSSRSYCVEGQAGRPIKVSFVVEFKRGEVTEHLSRRTTDRRTIEGKRLWSEIGYVFRRELGRGESKEEEEEL